MSLLCLNRHLPYAYVFRLRAKMLPFASRKNKTERRGGRGGGGGCRASFLSWKKKKKDCTREPCVPFSVTFRVTVFSMGAHLGTRKSAYVVLLPPFFFFSLSFGLLFVVSRSPRRWTPLERIDLSRRQTISGYSTFTTGWNVFSLVWCNLCTTFVMYRLKFSCKIS